MDSQKFTILRLKILRLRETLENDDFDKTEVNLKYGGREKNKEEVIKIGARTCKDRRL